MPSIHILTPRLDQPSKKRMARCFADSTRELLSVPVVKVLFQEYTTLYVNGAEETDGFATLSLEGPKRPQQALTRLCRSLCDNYRAISGDLTCRVSFIYHVIPQEYLGLNGVLGNTRPYPSPQDPTLPTEETAPTSP